MSFIQGSTDSLRGIDISFEPNPNTGDIPTLSRFSVIRKSLENLLSFNTLDKPFREDIGSELNQLLFNVVDLSDLPPLQSRIANTIERLEPRVSVREVFISPQFDKNLLEVTLSYVIRQTNERDEFSTVLQLSE